MKKIIRENQIGVLIQKGRFVAELQPGEVRFSPVLKKQSVEVFDIRPTYVSVADNFMISDKLSVLISVNLSYAIKSAQLYLKLVNDAYSLLRAMVSDQVRAWASSLTLEELLEKQAELQGRLEKAATPELQKSGLQLLSVSPPVVTLPRGLKQAVESKLIAAMKSQADLEEARGRTAVLRHYANAAKLTQENPELLKLLLGQKAKSLQVQFTDTPKPLKTK